MKHKFILFEGIDGSGKSTLAKQFAKEIDGTYYYSPPKIIRFLRRYADNSAPQLRYAYYLFGNMISSWQINNLLKRKHVVCDWYVYSTIAYHSVLMNKELKAPNILLPDNIIHVTADWKDIESRLNARSSRSKYENNGFLRKVSKKYQEIFSNFDNVIKVDTSSNSVNLILGSIKGRLVL